MAVPCEACGKAVSERAAACPHCGARREGAGIGPLSRDEAAALLALADRGGGSGQEGMFAILVLPHDRSHGGARLAQLALTAFGLPLIAAGAPMVLFAYWRTRRAAHATTSEWGAVGMLGVLGAPLAFFLLTMVGLGAAIAGPLVVAMLVGLLVRAGIRTRVDEARSRALSRLDTAAPLPPARATAAPRATPPAAAPPPSPSPSTSSPRLAPLAGAAPTREPAAGDPPADGPRLLR